MKNYSERTTRQPHKDSSSKFVGVSYSKVKKKWIAQIGINYKTKVLGAFDEELHAAAAYQDALREMIKKGEVKFIV